jgi:hypothetical protein
MLKEKEWLVKLRNALRFQQATAQRIAFNMIADRIIELAEQEQENEGPMGKLLKDHEEIIS